MSKDNGFVAINISNNDTSYPPNAKLFCNPCSCNLTLLDPQKEEWWCSRCHVSYYPNRGEKVSGLTVSQRRDRRQTNTVTSQARKCLWCQSSMMTKSCLQLMEKKSFPKSFEEMQRHGVKITSYTTTEDR